MSDSSKIELGKEAEVSDIQHDRSYIPNFPKDEASEKAYESMQKATEIYRNNPDLTLRMQITEQAFNRLKSQPGMKGPGYSHIKEVIAGTEMEYYLVASPYTNVERIRESDDQKQKALTLEVSLFSTQTDDEDVNFEMTEIGSNGVASVDDRSEVYPKDILKIDFIDALDAKKFIEAPKR